MPLAMSEIKKGIIAKHVCPTLFPKVSQGEARARAEKMAELKARGNAFFKAKHYDDAIGSYTDAIAAAPPLGVAYSTDEQVNHSAQHALSK